MTRSLNAELGLLICCFVFFFSQIASVAFSRYLFAQYNIVFVLTSDKKFERWARSASTVYPAIPALEFVNEKIFQIISFMILQNWIDW